MKNPFSMENNPFSTQTPFSQRGSPYSLPPSQGPTYDFRDEFTTSLVSASINTSACEPGPGTRTVVDTETCLSIIPNYGTALATHAGVTFGGCNNRCSYATGYGWMDFPTGFDAAAHAGAGRIEVGYDGNGRARWAFLGAAGSAETLSAELATGTLTKGRLYVNSRYRVKSFRNWQGYRRLFFLSWN